MANNPKHVFSALLACVATLVATSCSTTKGVPEGDQLYVGLKKIKYTNYEDNSYFSSTQEEMEAALDCAPNGAFMGSSFFLSQNLQFGTGPHGETLVRYLSSTGSAIIGGALGMRKAVKTHAEYAEKLADALQSRDILMSVR